MSDLWIGRGIFLNHVLFTCTIAKQTRANSNFPHLSGGFDYSLVYSNIYYVLKNMNNHLVPQHIRRGGPWLLWSIWKNSNSFLFEGKLALGPSFISSILEEVDHVFLIKDADKQEKVIDLERKNGSSLVGSLILFLG